MKNLNLDIENITFSYGEDIILKDITIHAHERESIGIIGENGAGKSTLLKLMVGLYLDFTGEIKVQGIPVKKKNLSEIRKMIGYVFQDSDSQLFMSTAYEDVAFAPRNYGLSEKEVDKRTTEALDRVGALGLRDKQIYKMSGGEKN